MKRKIVIALVVVLGSWSMAQERKNSIQLEVGGSGMLYSVAYERLEWERVALKAGVSYLRLTENGTHKYLNWASLPLSASYLIHLQKQCHFVELGAGVNMVYLSSTMNSFIVETDLYLNPTAIIAYRFHSPNGKWLARVACTPFYGTASLTDHRINQQPFSVVGSGLQCWGGVTVGYRF